LHKDKAVWRVLVVEDDPLMRDFFAGSVSRCPKLTLAASVGTVAEARAWMDGQETAADVLLTDLGLPDGSGLELIRHAIALNPHCEPLVISMFGDEDNVLPHLAHDRPACFVKIPFFKGKSGCSAHGC
jgi:DNA-binding NarL/FixJ family response regulator